MFTFSLSLQPPPPTPTPPQRKKKVVQSTQIRALIGYQRGRNSELQLMLFKLRKQGTVTNSQVYRYGSISFFGDAL